MNWSSDHCRSDVDPKLMFRLFSKVPENPGDQILKCVSATENFCALKSAAGQERFERLNQSSLRVRRKVVLNAFRTGPGFQSLAAPFLHLLKVKQRPIRVSQ